MADKNITCEITQEIAVLSENEKGYTKEINLVDAGHFPTENVVCPVLAAFLSKQFPELTVVQSTTHSCEVIQYCI